MNVFKNLSYVVFNDVITYKLISYTVAVNNLLLFSFFNIVAEVFFSLSFIFYFSYVDTVLYT